MNGPTIVRYFDGHLDARGVVLSEHVFRAYASIAIQRDVRITPRCLFVSDHDEDRAALTRFLQAFSIEVVPARVGWSSSDALTARADLVLIDLADPEQALWPLIDDKRCTHVGRVVLTATKESVARVLKLCVDAVLVKVFEPADLVDVVRDVARVARRRKAGALLRAP